MYQVKKGLPRYTKLDAFCIKIRYFVRKPDTAQTKEMPQFCDNREYVYAIDIEKVIKMFQQEEVFQKLIYFYTILKAPVIKLR